MDPYAAPTTSEPALAGQQSKLADFTFPQVKKLYHRSCNLSCIAFLMMFGVFVLLSITMMNLTGSETWMGEIELVLFGVMTVLYLLTFVGLCKRSAWGRILCIVVCIFLILSIFTGNIIGLIVGLAGLFACLGSPQLFGAGRFHHKELKTEFKARKSAAKLAKREQKQGR